jgi:hypothetical protein
VQSVPDATSSPSVDQEVPSVFHPVPFRFSFDPPSDPASVDAFIKAYPNLPGYHMWSTWDRLTAVSTYGPPGSEEDDEPDSGWDFSGLGNPSAMRDFMAACDYCLSDCSDDGHSLDDEDCGPSRECFHVDLEGLDEGNHLGMPEDSDPPRPAPRIDILRELVVVPVPAGGQDTQLEQIREMQARLDVGRSGQAELRPEKRVMWPRTSSTASPTMPGQGCPGFQWGRPEPGCSGNTTPSDAGTIHHRGATYLGRAQESPGGCCGPTGRKLYLPKARVPPEHRAATSRFMREASVHTGHTRAPGRLGNEHRHRDRRAHLDEKVHRGYHPRRGGRYDSGEDRSPLPEPPGL